MYLLPSSCRPLIEAALARVVREIRAGEMPAFGFDDNKPGWIAVGIVDVHDLVLELRKGETHAEVAQDTKED